MLSLFRRKMDPQKWFILFKAHLNSADAELRAVGGYIERLGTESPTEKYFTPSETEEISRIGEHLRQIYRECKQTRIPRDDYLNRVRKSFEGAVYGSWRFCQWLVKYSNEPSRARWANVMFFCSIALEMHK